jgi:hypothetical protein
MKFVFQEELQTMIHHYELELLLHKKLGKDLGDLTISFLTEVPAPWCWPISPMSSPWDPLISVDACDGVLLPGVVNWC